MKSRLIIIGLIISIMAAGLYYWDYNRIEPEIENEISKNKKVENSSISEDNNQDIEDVSEITILNDNTSEIIIKENIIQENSEDIIIDSKESNNSKENKTDNKHEKVSKPANDGKSKPKKETKHQNEPKPAKVKPSPKEIEASIVEKYTVLFQILKSEYEVKLNDMINKAKKEYLSLSEEERDKQKFNLAVKYLKLGRALEGECDKKFYAFLDQMKAELKDNNLKKDSANAAEKQYKEEKSTRQKQLLDKTL